MTAARALEGAPGTGTARRGAADVRRLEHGAGGLEAIRTLPELLRWRVARSPAHVAYREYERETDAWRSWSWHQVREAVDQMVGAFASLGLERGARVALLLPNGVDATCIDQAALAIGAVPVPMHALDNAQSIGWILAVTANAPEDNDPGTVGRPLAGVELRLGESQELQVRGPNVMRGYWNRPAETAAAFVDGWLRTGDQAAIEDGRVRIVGRLKDILVTANGEKIAPADVEQAILGDALFEQAFVVGEGRPFIGCVVVLSGPGWAGLAERACLDPSDPASLEAPAAVGAAMRRIQRQTAALPRHGQPRRVVLTLEPWTLDNGLLTPTLKLKRMNLETRFAARIEAMYAQPVAAVR